MKNIFYVHLITMLIFGSVVTFLPAHSQTPDTISSAQDIAWHPDGTKLAVTGNFGLAIYDANFQIEKQIIRLFTDLVQWSPDGRLIATSGFSFASNAYHVSLWDAQSNSSIATFNTPPVVTLAWSPDSQQLVVATYTGNINVYEVSTQKLLLTITSPTSLDDAALSPDGNYMAALGGNRREPIIYVWDITTGAMSFSVDLALSGIYTVTQLAWSPDNSKITLGTTASSGGGAIPNLDVTSQAISGWNSTLTGTVNFLLWHPDGARIAVAETGPLGENLYVWDFLARELIWKKGVTDVGSFYRGTWNPTGSYLTMTASSYQTDSVGIYIFDGATGDEITQLILPPPDPTAVIWGTVWNDLNEDGIYQDNETGLGEITIELWDRSGLVAQTDTLANGQYRFEITPGTYQLEVSDPTYALTNLNQGEDDLIDSDFDPTTNQSNAITLSDSEMITMDAGLSR